MVRVEFLGPINKEPIEIEAKNLSDLASALKKYPEISKWLGKCAVSINGEIARDINAPLKDGDNIALLPPVCGG